MPGESKPAERPVERFSLSGIAWRPAPDIEGRRAADANPRSYVSAKAPRQRGIAYLGPGFDTHGHNAKNSIAAQASPTGEAERSRAAQSPLVTRLLLERRQSRYRDVAATHDTRWPRAWLAPRAPPQLSVTIRHPRAQRVRWIG